MLVLITGGSGSGKSEYAENLAAAMGEKLYYIATMYPYDKECLLRIERHRAVRKEKNFRTIECYTGLDELQIESRTTVLLECMSNLVANEMYQEKGAGERTLERVLTGIRKLKQKAEHLIIVTNEVFSDGIPYDQGTDHYRDILGKINRQIGRMSDTVIEVVYTIPIYQKG